MPPESHSKRRWICFLFKYGVPGTRQAWSDILVPDQNRMLSHPGDLRGWPEGAGGRLQFSGEVRVVIMGRPEDKEVRRRVPIPPPVHHPRLWRELLSDGLDGPHLDPILARHRRYRRYPKCSITIF